MNLILLQVVSLVYILLLNLFYFSKKHLDSVENRVYKYLLFSNVIGLLIDLACFYTVMNMEQIPGINAFVTKLLLVYYLWFITVYTYYVFVISFKDEKKANFNLFLKKVRLYCFVGLLFASMLVCYFPMYYYNDGKFVYSYGPSVNCLSIILVVVMTIWLIIIIKKYKNIKTHKYLPVIAFIVLAGIGGTIQNMYPYMLLTTPIESLIIFLMYFTIENPDMKLLKEVHEAKVISDNANEEKTLFLYNMTQEIRETTKNIDNESDIIIDSDSLELDKESARNIKGETSKFRMMTNDILDVSAIDSSSIKIYNSTYNLKLLLKSLIGSYTEVCKNKLIEFRPNIEHDIPDMLYGDNISLKKVIKSLLTYSAKNTSKGYVELNINTIKKNDICRLIISIEDSSNGIKSDELEKIKVENKNINEAYKMITVMNGTMVLTSNYGIGTKIKIILDQKMDMSNNGESKKYNEIYNNKKILVIDDSESSIKIIDKLLRGSNIIIDSVLNGRDAIAKIKTKNRYDLILLDEELSQISGLELLKKLESIRNFNIPVILLSKDNKYEYNEEYLKMGFSDILIKPLKKEILLEKIDKFIQRNEM